MKNITILTERNVRECRETRANGELFNTMSSSPIKESAVTKLPPPQTSLPLLAPPSPHSHRLRRLQSAHTLGQSSHQPSLISQQHKQVLQRNISPSKKDTPGRARANSDATLNSPSLGSAGRQPILKRKSTADMFSLDRLIRDGPPDGDIQGGLEATRLKILDQGIKSDSDGMVRFDTPQVNLAKFRPVLTPNLRLAHPAQRPRPRD